jgi:plastocyanin
MRHVAWLALGGAAVLLGACGGGGSGSSGGATGTCTPRQSATITIQASGVSPTAVCVLPNGTVTFTNSDAVAHDIESTAACAELDLGSIAPQQSKTTLAFETAGTCTFHDQTNPSNASFQGTVAVSSAPTTGPGY